jgi:hypothetical protein
VRSRELLCSSSHGLHCGVRPLTLAVCAASQLIVRHWFVERQTSKLNHTILPRNVVLEDSAAAMAGLRSGTSLRSGRDFSRSGCTRLHYVFVVMQRTTHWFVVPLRCRCTRRKHHGAQYSSSKPTSAPGSPTRPIEALNAMSLAQTSQAQRLLSAQAASVLVLPPPSPTQPVPASTS